MLRAVGGLLVARLREGYCLARIGSEEFLAALSVVERADRAGHDAKHGGRDRVEFYRHEPAITPEPLPPARLH